MCFEVWDLFAFAMLCYVPRRARARTTAIVGIITGFVVVSVVLAVVLLLALPQSDSSPAAPAIRQPGGGGGGGIGHGCDAQLCCMPAASPPTSIEFVGGAACVLGCLQPILAGVASSPVLIQLTTTAPFADYAGAATSYAIAYGLCAALANLTSTPCNYRSVQVAYQTGNTAQKTTFVYSVQFYAAPAANNAQPTQLLSTLATNWGTYVKSLQNGGRLSLTSNVTAYSAAGGLPWAPFPPRAPSPPPLSCVGCLCP